jgi:hypothetical protein
MKVRVHAAMAALGGTVPAGAGARAWYFSARMDHEKELL